MTPRRERADRGLQALDLEGHHYRFGLAGEGQADIVAARLDSRRGGVASIGCGGSPEKVAALARHCWRLLAIDKLPECLRSIQHGDVPPNVCLCTGDAHALPFADNSVDHIVAFGLFAYVVDTIRVLQEFRRVCRRGGWIMITNSVSHSPQKFRDAATEASLTIVEEHEGYCPAASGAIKRRELIVYEKQG